MGLMLYYLFLLYVLETVLGTNPVYEKPGKCPALDDMPKSCIATCDKDFDCGGALKCCWNDSRCSQCREPIDIDITEYPDSCPSVVLFGAGQKCPANECAVDRNCQFGWKCCKVSDESCGGMRCVQPQFPVRNNQGSRVGALRIEGSDNKACPDILCLEECEYGHRRDSDNCVTCECNSRSTMRRDRNGCLVLTCDLYCGYRGYQQDLRGCKLCRCNTVWMPCPPANCPKDDDCTAEFVNEGGCIKCQCKCPTFNPRTDCPKNCPTKIVEGKYGCKSCVCDSPSTGHQVPGSSWPLTNPWQIQTNPFQSQWPFTSPISSPFVSNINVNPYAPVKPPYPPNTNTNPFLPNRPTNTNPYLPNTNTNTNPYLPNTNTNTNPFLPNTNTNTNPFLPNRPTNTNPFLPNRPTNTNPYLPNTNTNTNPYLPNTNTNTNPYLPNTNTNTNPYLPNTNTNTNPYLPNTNTNTNPYLPNTNTNTNPNFPFPNNNCPQSNCNLNCPYGIIQENDANNCITCRCSLSQCQESGLICSPGTTCQVFAGTPRCVNTATNNNNQGVLSTQCQSRPVCTVWCPNGYVLDAQGCPTCQCQTMPSRNNEPRCAADSPTKAQCYVVRGNPFTSNPSQPTNPVNPPYVDTSSCTQCTNQRQCTYGLLKNSNGCPICNGRCAQTSCDACHQNEICVQRIFSPIVTSRVSCHNLATGQVTERQLSLANNYFTSALTS